MQFLTAKYKEYTGKMLNCTIVRVMDDKVVIITAKGQLEQADFDELRDVGGHIDHYELLKKYIRHVTAEEGYNFIPDDVGVFTDDELAALYEMSKADA